MRVLHLNTHASGGSYEYAALLSTALVEQGIESRVLCKIRRQHKPGRVLLDRVIRRAYVSFSTEPWHGTRRLLCPPGPEELKGVDVVHLHTVADWFDVPSWLETLPLRIGVVISIHDMWHVTGGCFLYRGCDRYAKQMQPCDPCPILKMACKPVSGKGCAFSESCGHIGIVVPGWSQTVTGWPKSAGRSPIVKACGGVRSNSAWYRHDSF